MSRGRWPPKKLDENSKAKERSRVQLRERWDEEKQPEAHSNGGYVREVTGNPKSSGAG